MLADERVERAVPQRHGAVRLDHRLVALTLEQGQHAAPVAAGRTRRREALALATGRIEDLRRCGRVVLDALGEDAGGEVVATRRQAHRHVAIGRPDVELRRPARAGPGTAAPAPVPGLEQPRLHETIQVEGRERPADPRARRGLVPVDRRPCGRHERVEAPADRVGQRGELVEVGGRGGDG